MKKYLRIFMLLFFISFGFSSYAAQGDANSLKTAPAFQLADLNDKIVSLSDYKGKKAVILFFWTTWCPYCRAELKTLNAKSADLAKASVVLLAVNVGETKDKAANFVKSRNLSFEILLDKDSQVTELYDLLGVPTYFVINKSGEVVSTENHFPENFIKELSSK